MNQSPGHDPGRMLELVVYGKLKTGKLNTLTVVGSFGETFLQFETFLTHSLRD